MRPRERDWAHPRPPSEARLLWAIGQAGSCSLVECWRLPAKACSPSSGYPTSRGPIFTYSGPIPSTRQRASICTATPKNSAAAGGRSNRQARCGAGECSSDIPISPNDVEPTLGHIAECLACVGRQRPIIGPKTPTYFPAFLRVSYTLETCSRIMLSDGT